MSANLKIDTSAINAIAQKLGASGEQIARAQFRAINKVANKAMTRSRREIVSQVNLTQTYVRDRMDLQPASLTKASATIVARVRPTTLGTYGARQLTASAPRAKGNPRLGIPARRKQAGIAVGVKRGGGKKKMPYAFLLPLRAGKVAGGNGMGVFTRDGSELRHRYGPSVDQVFRGVISKIKDDVSSELEEALFKQVQYEIKKALK